MITRRYLEKKSTVLGLPMQELGMLVAVGMLLLVGSGVAKLIAPRLGNPSHLTLLVVGSGYLLLRFAASKKHPSFLLSHLSYYLLQRNGRFEPSAAAIL